MRTDAPQKPSLPEQDQLLRVDQFAALVNVSRRKAYEIWASPDSPPLVILGPRSRRVRLGDAVAWIQSRRSA